MSNECTTPIRDLSARNALDEQAGSLFHSKLTGRVLPHKLSALEPLQGREKTALLVAKGDRGIRCIIFGQEVYAWLSKSHRRIN
jgi:hypothetical protein